MSFNPVTPLVAVDIVLTYGRAIVAIQRKYPPLGRALPGGFVDVGETLKQAAIRETQEETSIILYEDQVRSLGYLDDPKRDPRRHVISFGFTAELRDYQFAQLKAADDAASVEWIDVFTNPDEFVMNHGHYVKMIQDEYTRGMNGM